MGLLSTLFRQQQPGGDPNAAATLNAQPQFTKDMARTGQLQQGAYQPQQPQAPNTDSQLAMMLQLDPFQGQRVAQMLQQRFPQKLRGVGPIGGGIR